MQAQPAYRIAFMPPPGCGNDLSDIGIPGLPPQSLANFVRAGQNMGPVPNRLHEYKFFLSANYNNKKTWFRPSPNV
ncbi:hypothetical protein [Sporomusa termitida]|uniref:hypothetical protein n=1 Tax=Sporomusa termitida TaxID=2377 RepID=UPI0014797A20|nr:hypothetical protein [Sporomusa termitida]